MLALGAVLALLDGCRTPTRQALQRAAPAPTAAGPRYRVDASRSELRILVYRAGALARLGHNHVLLSRAPEGELALPAASVLSGASFSVTVPVDSLEVDDAAARSAEGEEFAAVPTPADVAGTRRNLLGPFVLNAADCPELAVQGTTELDAGALVARARPEVCGHETSLLVPLEVAERSGELTIRGGFSVRQSELGLVPFSIALGAIAVRDELEVRFTLVAVPEAGG